jgi:hypothetical protein
VLEELDRAIELSLAVRSKGFEAGFLSLLSGKSVNQSAEPCSSLSLNNGDVS